MSSYVFMKVLESTPERYDRGIRMLSGGVIDEVYEAIAERAAGPGRAVLDVGCGTGGVALACAARGAHVWAVDRNAGMLEVARRKSAGRALEGSVEWIELGALEIEDRFAPRSFDAVVSSLMLSEMWPEQRAHFLRTARSRLRPDGVLVVADEVVPDTRARRLRWRARRMPLVAATYLLSQTTTHALDDLAGAVRAAGFAGVTETRFGRYGELAVVEGRDPEPSP